MGRLGLVQVFIGREIKTGIDFEGSLEGLDRFLIVSFHEKNEPYIIL